MSFKKELISINEYIENFDARQFSSSADFTKISSPTEKHLERARKIKERMVRKQALAEAFEKGLENGEYGDCSVTITQEEIDALF